MKFSFLSWNVENFSGGADRAREVARHVKPGRSGFARRIGLGAARAGCQDNVVGGMGKLVCPCCSG